MSIELPEAQILAERMNKELRGKKIASCHLQDYERLQRVGFLNRDTRTFDQLVNGKIESIISRGTVIRVKLDNGMNLLLAPEYGGRVLYHAGGNTVPKKLHLRVDFTDDTVLTVRLTGMGLIYAVKDDELKRVYVYRRDFSEVSSPVDDEEFTFEHFSKLLADNTKMLKSVLVGKDAVVVGLGNSAYQDIIYRAKLHPKRKVSELSEDEKRALYDAIKLVVHERIRLGGKDQFIDLYGNQGGYTPAMGPNMKQ
ncbi:MAG: DNA-formamidopyrimidine glycosylase family protein [Candidatus Bathyarchaeia archaeon]